MHTQEKSKKSDLSLIPFSKNLIWIAIFLAIISIFVLIKDCVLPFILGLTIAYMLNPCVVYLSDFKIPRPLASIVMVSIFLTTIFLVFFFAFPLIKSELQHLLINLPFYIERFQSKIANFTDIVRKNIAIDHLLVVQNLIEQSVREALHWLGIEIAHFLRQSLGLKNIFSLVLITPVAAFYCLKDWPIITQFLDNLLPRPYRPFITQQVAEINRVLANFARGQTRVCLVLTLYYITTLGMIHLNFFLVLGMLTGVLSFIPYVGAFIGFCAAIIIAIGQMTPSSLISWVIVIFSFGQLLEGYILTPRLVGHKIGLPPLWIIFSLIVGGNIFGFGGLILAIPVAATLGVLVRSGLRFYQNSRLYIE